MLFNKDKQIERMLVEIIICASEKHFDNNISKDNIKELEKVINSQLYFNTDPKYTFEIELDFVNGKIRLERFKTFDRKTGKEV